MKIIGSLSKKTYEVKYASAGWSYAVPVIYSKRRVFGFSAGWIRIELPHNPKSFQTVSEWGPIPLQQWFQESVDKYETYHHEWETFKSINSNGV